MINICDFVQVSSLKEGAQLSISGLLDVGIEDGRYEVKNGKIRRKEMQKEKKYTDAEVLAILIEELDKKYAVYTIMHKLDDPLLSIYYVRTSSYSSYFYLASNYITVYIKKRKEIIHYKEPQSINRILALVDEAMGVQKQEEKPKFKVGDRVRILSDAVYYDGDALEGTVITGKIKSAIGKIGFIESISPKNRIAVRGLPDECGCSWFYESSFLELIEEEHEPITPKNIEEVLKYNGFCKNTKLNTKIISEIYRTQYSFVNTTLQIHVYFNIMEEYKSNPNYKCLINSNLPYGEVLGELKTNNFDELIRFVNQYIELKPLPKKKEPTLEEALIELGFKKYDRYSCNKGNIYFLYEQKEVFIRMEYHKTRQSITYTTKEQLIKDIADFEKKNRPHWSLVDDGGHGKEIGKIYREGCNNNSDVYYAIKHGLEKLGLWETVYNYFPTQKYNQETDFGILCKNGSFIKAFWRGEE